MTGVQTCALPICKCSNYAHGIDKALLPRSARVECMSDLAFSALIKTLTVDAQIQITKLRKKIMKYLSMSIIILLCGCVSNSGIIPMGSETYMVSRQAAS